jgi:predicted chitinase
VRSSSQRRPVQPSRFSQQSRQPSRFSQQQQMPRPRPRPQQQQQQMQRPQPQPPMPRPRPQQQQQQQMQRPQPLMQQQQRQAPTPVTRPPPPPQMTFSNGAPLNRQQTRDVLLKSLRDAGITNPRAQANIIANIEVESRLVPKSESMNYSPAGLRGTFPKYFNAQQAQQFGRQGKTPLNAQQQEAIANRAYGGRMGNAQNEGYMYRGRGFIQLTGKDNYDRFGKKIGVDLVRNPDLVNHPDVAAKVAAAYFTPYTSGTQLNDINRVIGIVGPADKASFPERRRLADQWYREINGIKQ